MTGALIGALGGVGLWMVGLRLVALRRPDFAGRVLRHLPDLPRNGGEAQPAASGPLAAVYGPLLREAADRLERILGGATSVRRRIQRAGLDLTLADFRVQQVVWGLAGFGSAAVLALLVVPQSPDRAAPLAILCLCSGAVGVLLRENRLTAQVRQHERQVLTELPGAAELLALSVAAGEGPVSALERVVRRSHGALARELSGVLAHVRTGTPVGHAFDDYSRRTGLPAVARFASGIAVAIERGTPLADVLHAQAGDVREAQRRELIESGARREVFMMVPVVFLVLPTTIVFAFWPGLIGMRLVTS